MAEKKSKTNPNRLRGVQKKHYCPTCDDLSALYMVMPKRRMMGRCEKGHEHTKRELVRR